MRPLATAVLLALLCARAGAGTGVFADSKRRVRFKVPAEDYILRSKKMRLGVEGAIAEFEGRDGKSAGLLLYAAEGKPAKERAKWRGQEFEKRATSCTWEREEALKRGEGDWLLVEFTVERADSELRYVDVIAVRGNDTFELLTWCADADAEALAEKLAGIAQSLEFGDFADEAGDEEEPEPKDPPKPDPADPPAPETTGPSVGGGIWADVSRGVGVRGPKEWKVATDPGAFGIKDPYEVFEFQSGDDEVLVGLCELESPLQPKAFADRAIEGLSKTWQNLKPLEGKAPAGMERRDFRADIGEKGFRVAFVVFARNGRLYWLEAIVGEEKWGEAEGKVEGCIAGIVTGDAVAGLAEEAAKAPAGGGGADPGGGGGADPGTGGGTDPGAGNGGETLLPNPWEGCGRGSWAKYRSVSEVGGARTEMEMTITLVEFDAESYTQRTDMVMNGAAIPGTEMKVNRRQKVPAGGEAPKPETGEETVTVPKGEFACAWTRTKTEQGVSTTWSCRDVPLQMVKTVSEFSGSKTVLELVDFEKK